MKVVAFSADNADEARAMGQEFHVTFPLGYDLNVRDFVDKTGAYFHADKGFVHATNFIVRPDGRVATACYSSGAIGRFWAADTIMQMDYLIKKEGTGITVHPETGQISP